MRQRNSSMIAGGVVLGLVLAGALSTACRPAPTEDDITTPKVVTPDGPSPSGEPGGCGLADLAELSRSARVVPEIRDGKVTGFRLHAIRPDAAAARLGLRNGDIVRAAAGVAMTSPEAAMEAYVRSRIGKHPTLTVERDGKQLEIPCQGDRNDPRR